MKVLVATHETQGKRKNDFSWTTDGEPVLFGFECDGERVDGSCGCRRALVGAHSMKATTTFKVAEMPGLNKQDFMDICNAHLQKAGWTGLTAEGLCMDELLKIADRFPINAVLEKRGGIVQVRQV